MITPFHRKGNEEETGRDIIIVIIISLMRRNAA